MAFAHVFICVSCYHSMLILAAHLVLLVGSSAFLIYFVFPDGTVITGLADVVALLLTLSVSQLQGIMTVPGASKFAKNCPLDVSLHSGNDMYGYQETKHHTVRRTELQCDLCGNVRHDSGVMIGASDLW